MLLECPGLRPLFGTLHCQRYLPSFLFLCCLFSHSVQYNAIQTWTLFFGCLCCWRRVLASLLSLFCSSNTHFALLNKTGVSCLFSDPVPCHLLRISPDYCVWLLQLALFLLGYLSNEKIPIAIYFGQFLRINAGLQVSKKILLVANKTKLNCCPPLQNCFADSI